MRNVHLKMSYGKDRQYPAALKFNFDVTITLSHTYQELNCAFFYNKTV